MTIPNPTLSAPVADSYLPAIEAVRERLLDSEEHAVESAIPGVAEDAAALLQTLAAELSRLEAEKQDLVSQRDEAVGRVGTLYAIVNSLSPQLPHGPKEEYAYQAELESTRDYLGLK